MPTSTSSILCDKFPPSPDSNTAPPARIPTPTDASNPRGQKRHTDANPDSLSHPKRTHVACDTAKAIPSLVRPSNEYVSGAKRACSSCGIGIIAPKDLPPPQINEAPLSTQVTRSTNTATNTPSAAQSQVEPLSPTPSRHKLKATHDVPAWFSKALSMLKCDGVDLRPLWKRVVQHWVAFETKEKYRCGVAGKLKAKHRPAIMVDWIQQVHSPSWRPVISDIQAIEESFSKWWASLQPNWHINKVCRLDMTATEGSWEPLRQAGVNGVLSVVAALFFWGLAACSNAAAHDKWLCFVDNCIVMLDGLVAAS